MRLPAPAPAAATSILTSLIGQGTQGILAHLNYNTSQAAVHFSEQFPPGRYFCWRLRGLLRALKAAVRERNDLTESGTNCLRTSIEIAQRKSPLPSRISSPKVEVLQAKVQHAHKHHSR